MSVNVVAYYRVSTQKQGHRGWVWMLSGHSVGSLRTNVSRSQRSIEIETGQGRRRAERGLN